MHWTPQVICPITLMALVVTFVEATINLISLRPYQPRRRCSGSSRCRCLTACTYFSSWRSPTNPPQPPNKHTLTLVVLSCSCSIFLSQYDTWRFWIKKPICNCELLAGNNSMTHATALPFIVRVCGKGRMMFPHNPNYNYPDPPRAQRIRRLGINCFVNDR